MTLPGTSSDRRHRGALPRSHDKPPATSRSSRSRRRWRASRTDVTRMPPERLGRLRDPLPDPGAPDASARLRPCARRTCGRSSRATGINQAAPTPLRTRPRSGRDRVRKFHAALATTNRPAPRLSPANARFCRPSSLRAEATSYATVPRLRTARSRAHIGGRSQSLSANVSLSSRERDHQKTRRDRNHALDFLFFFFF